MPENSLTPSATAASTAMVGKRSVQSDRSARMAFSFFALPTVTLFPFTATGAPISLRKSSMTLSPCKLFGFKFSISTPPETAPIARKYEAEDQSPSTS